MVRKKIKKSIRRIAYLFCEGEKTEKYYFEGLRKDYSNIFSIKIICSQDRNPKNMISYAKEYLKRTSYDDEKDIVFCIFDKDDNTNIELNSAKKLAIKYHYNLIFSNPSFEFWFLCHFGEFEYAYDKDGLNYKLNTFLKKYDKTDLFLYEKTKEKIKKAIIHAKKIEQKHISNNIEIISRESNPSTNIYKIIEILSK